MIYPTYPDHFPARSAAPILTALGSAVCVTSKAGPLLALRAGPPPLFWISGREVRPLIELLGFVAYCASTCFLVLCFSLCVYSLPALNSRIGEKYGKCTRMTRMTRSSAVHCLPPPLSCHPPRLGLYKKPQNKTTHRRIELRTFGSSSS